MEFGTSAQNYQQMAQPLQTEQAFMPSLGLDYKFFPSFQPPCPQQQNLYGSYSNDTAVLQQQILMQQILELQQQQHLQQMFKIQQELQLYQGEQQYRQCYDSTYLSCDIPLTNRSLSYLSMEDASGTWPSNSAPSDVAPADLMLAQNAYGSGRSLTSSIDHSAGNSTHLGQYTSLAASVAAASATAHSAPSTPAPVMSSSYPKDGLQTNESGTSWHKRRSAGDARVSPTPQFSMTRGARKQMNAILDEFWGGFYNLHGQPLFRNPATPVAPNIQSGQELYTSVKDCVNSIMKVAGASTLLENQFKGDRSSGNGHLYPSLSHHTDVVAALCHPDSDSLVALLCSTGHPHGVAADVFSCIGPFPTQTGLCTASPDWSTIGPSVFLSFGIWCIFKLLMLCQAETRPELWGKFAYVLNKLQGFIQDCHTDHMGGRAKAYHNIPGCKRVGLTNSHLAGLRQDIANLLTVLQLSLAEKKGPAGTAAGEIAFPKGKEIMQSVINRYRRKMGISDTLTIPAASRQHQQQPEGRRVSDMISQ
eukprot:gene24341-9956_t